MRAAMLAVAIAGSLAACSGQDAANDAQSNLANAIALPGPVEPPGKGAAVTGNAVSATPSSGVAFPASLRTIGEGYPAAGDPCRRLAESAATVNWLDDSAILVGCPTSDQARALSGKVVGVVDGITLVSVGTGDANAGLAGSSQP